MIATTRYEVLGHIASGGMGEILLARQRGPAGFEKMVVLKRPHVRLPSGQQARALLDEARLLARINHPNVCQVLDLELAHDEIYLVLELLEGLSLWAILVALEEAGEALAPRELCGLLEQACDGLHAIHELGVIHRDVSPGNLFVTEAGTLKLLDLGIAKARDTRDRTAPGAIKGKLPYLSPEQVSGRTLDGRSDLFSLGLVMYDLARGQRPRHDRIGAFAREHLELAALEPAIAEIIARAVAHEPADRFGSAAEMAQALRAAALGCGGTPTRSELEHWLASKFSDALARHRRTTAETVAQGESTTASRRTLTMRSLLPMEHGELLTPLTNGTERLAVPDYEEGLARARTIAPRRNARFLVALPGLAIVVGVASALATSGGARQEVAAALPPPPPPEVAPIEAPPPEPPAAPAEPAPVAPVETLTPAPPDRVAPPAQVRPKPQNGSLTVDSEPAARIEIAGHRDETPVFRYALAPGAYVLSATLPDGRTQQRRVRLRAGKTTILKLAWEP